MANFFSGFEFGDATEWSTTEGTDFSFPAAAAINGAYGFRAGAGNLSDSGVIRINQTSLDNPNEYAGFHYKPSGLPVTTTMQIFEFNGLFLRIVQNPNGKLHLDIAANTSDLGSTVLSINNTYLIEIRAWKNDTSGVASYSKLTASLWIDRKEELTLSVDTEAAGFFNPTSTLARIGKLQGYNNSFQADFDNFYYTFTKKLGACRFVAFILPTGDTTLSSDGTWGKSADCSDATPTDKYTEVDEGLPPDDATSYVCKTTSGNQLFTKPSANLPADSYLQAIGCWAYHAYVDPGTPGTPRVKIRHPDGTASLIARDWGAQVFSTGFTWTGSYSILRPTLNIPWTPTTADEANVGFTRILGTSGVVTRCSTILAAIVYDDEPHRQRIVQLNQAVNRSNTY